MKTERETVAPGGAQKTKGKRSKLSQRRRDDETGVLPSLRVGGDGTHGTNGDDPNDTNLKGFFATGDPLGLDVGDGAQQRPTLNHHIRPLVDSHAHRPSSRQEGLERPHHRATSLAKFVSRLDPAVPPASELGVHQPSSACQQDQLQRLAGCQLRKI